MRHLTIISHTEHYMHPDGGIVGLGSTVTEINHLLDIFDSITHVAMLHDRVAPPSALPYSSDRICFVPLPAVGGTGILDKLSIILKATQIIGIIRHSLKNADYFQFRAPTGIGVFVIPYFILFSSKKGWFKYAGNWKQEQAPLAYRFQRWLLTQQSRTVTINGIWDDQPVHCLSFENPCLTEEEVLDGAAYMAQKTFQTPFHLCFVGRLEAAKGIDLMIEAIANLPKAFKERIGVIHIVGDGALMDFYKQQVQSLDVTIIFHGFLSRNKVHAIYKDSHAIVLPSASEGFPKVIAEAMNYGCVPIVSNVSSIGHYINDGSNGFLLATLDAKGLETCLLLLMDLSEQEYQAMFLNDSNLVKRFTYAYYNKRLLEAVL